MTDAAPKLTLDRERARRVLLRVLSGPMADRVLAGLEREAELGEQEAPAEPTEMERAAARAAARRLRLHVRK